MSERDLLRIVVEVSPVPDVGQLAELSRELGPELQEMAESASLRLVGEPSTQIVRRRRDLDPPHPFLLGRRSTGRSTGPDPALDQVLRDYPRRCLVQVSQWGEPDGVRSEFEDELGGRVVGWGDRPIMPDGDGQNAGCAVLHMDQFGRAILHPNPAVPCSHRHLFLDAVRLVRNFRELGPTRGWNAIGKSGHVTLIVAAGGASTAYANRFSPLTPVLGPPADLLAVRGPGGD